MLDSNYLEFIASVGASVAASGFAYGKMKERTDRLAEDVKQLREQQKELVPFSYFDAVIGPMARMLETVQKDIKEVLRAVSSNRHEK